MTPEPPAPAVRCQDVRKHFGDGETRTEVLRGVDFTADPGRLTFIVGPSGCGKTTLISLIAGLLDPSSGEVQVFDQVLARLSAEQIGRASCRERV